MRLTKVCHFQMSRCYAVRMRLCSLKQRVDFCQWVTYALKHSAQLWSLVPRERDGIVRNLGINTNNFFLLLTAEFHEKEGVTFSIDETGVWLKLESQDPQLRIIPMQMRSLSHWIQILYICSPFKLKDEVTTLWLERVFCWSWLNTLKVLILKDCWSTLHLKLQPSPDPFPGHHFQTALWA